MLRSFRFLRIEIMRLIKSMITFHGDYFPLSDPWANRAGDVAEYFVSLWTLLEWCCDMGDVGLWHHWNICWVWHQARVTCHVVTSRDVTWHIWLKHQHTPNTWGNQYTLTSPRIWIKSFKQHLNSNCGSKNSSMGWIGWKQHFLKRIVLKLSSSDLLCVL